MQSSDPSQKFSQSLLEEIKDNTKKYREISQIAYYSSLESIEQLQVFTKSSCDVECNVVFCYHAEKYRSDHREEIMLYIIRTLNEEIPKLKKLFSIAYVHDSISNFMYFRSILKLLPAEFLAKLKDFYIVHAGIAVKFVEMLSFGEISNYIRERTMYYQNLDEIESANKIIFDSNVNKSKLKLQANGGPTVQSLNKQSNSTEVQVIKNKLYGKEIEQYEKDKHEIPTVISSLVVRLFSSMAFLRAEGIMRKSCDVEQLEILEGHIMDDPGWESFIMNYDNPYVLCGCLKKIFNNLNSPLFSYEIYEQIISYRSDGQLENDIKFLQTCISSMNKTNQVVLFYIIAFLIKGIITYQEENKMSAYNLAVVFGPCFFRPKQYSLQDLMSSGKFSFMIKLLLENFEDVVGGEVAVNMFNLLEKQKMEVRGV